MEDLKMLLIIIGFIAFALVAGGALLALVAKVMMANEINRNGYLSDLDEEDDEENGNSDNN